MGSSYQTILATGDEGAVRAAVARSGQDAQVTAVGADRWAVVPSSHASLEGLAALLSTDCLAAAFDVFDSDVLVARLFRDGQGYHDYLSDQSYLVEAWDDDDNEIRYDMLSRPYPLDLEPPPGAFGADAAAFAPLGVPPVDLAALQAALAGPASMADEQHHDILHALNVDPRPLQMTFHQE